MKKALLSLVVLAATLAVNAETLTIYDGVGSNAYTPFHTTYCDEVGTTSQVLYPAEDLADMNGKQISAVKFFFNSDGAKFSGGKYQVSVAETTTNPYGVMVTTAPTFEGGMVVAIVDGPAVGDAELTITFDEPYTYNGGMLMIQTVVTESGNWGTSYFVGRTTTNYQGFGRNQCYRFLPKTEFTYAQDHVTGIEALTEGKAVKSVRYFNVAGQQAAAAFQGVNIVVVDYQDGTQAVTKVVK